MRIITGQYKGRKLKLPSNPSFRPTSDRARETLFNVLGQNLTGKSFIDCFSGSGAVGLEAASRGANPVTLVENNRKNGALIKSNIALCGAESVTNLVICDALSFLRSIDKSETRFDILFLDPPYHEGYYEKIFDTINNWERLSGGIVVIEHPSKMKLPGCAKIQLFKSSRIGDTTLSSFEFTMD